mmetsp:Transcript_13731/g.25286  ORF Transcript_13731/g.25286 Transcript_13731/m.25286 type:complete len:487 (+) Transcript_13731:26-1486(+)
MATLHDELFGSDSDSDNEGAAASAAVAPTQQKFDVDDLFGSDSESESESPAQEKPVSRLKKSGDKATKKKKSDSAARPKKRSSDEAAGRAEKRPRADEGAAGDGNAYDSGDEVVANAADASFIDSDDDQEDIRKEYDAERQQFNDRPDGEFDRSDDEDGGGGGTLGKKSKAASSSSGGGGGKIDAKSTNMIDQAILGSRKKRTKDMPAQDKQILVTALLEKMDDAWRRDMDALGADPPRPAVHKLAMLDKVERLLKQVALHETLLDFNVLEMARNWLQPWPSEDRSGRDLPLAKRTLPNLTLRARLYNCLQTMPIRPEHLKNSERGGDGDRPGLGKVVIMLLQHPGETSDHKRQLKALLEEWSRHIFGKTKDFKQLPRTLRESASAGVGSGGAAKRPALKRSGSEAVDDYLGGNAAQDAVDTSRVVRPFRNGYDFKVKPSAPTLEAVKVGKMQNKKNELNRKAKETKRKLKMGSQRGEAPLHRVDL